MNKIERQVELFKVLSDPTRLRLIQLLGDCKPDDCEGGPLCVNALAQRLEVTQSAVSQHLRILRQAGLVRGIRRGAFMHYFLNPDGIHSCKTALDEVLGKLFSSA